MEMTIAVRTALLIGASGLVGGALLETLLADPAYLAVTVLVRRPLARAHPKLTQVTADFDHLDQYRAYFHVDDLFCALGTTIKQAGSQAAFRRVDFDYPVALARLAKDEGAGHYLLVSSVGADPQSRIFYSRIKGEVEAAIQAIGYPTVSIFRPSLLLGQRRPRRPMEELSGLITKPFGWALGKYRPIEAKTVAQAMVIKAKDPFPGIHLYPSNEIHAIIGTRRSAQASMSNE
jgi:uncharacterized protein YbjT (DUF2867 family)